jgi:hypothetical protein
LNSKGNPHVTPLETSIQCGPEKVKKTYAIFLEWAAAHDLRPFESPYLGLSVHVSAPLPVTVNGDPARDRIREVLLKWQ